MSVILSAAAQPPVLYIMETAAQREEGVSVLQSTAAHPLVLDSIETAAQQEEE